MAFQVLAILTMSPQLPHVNPQSMQVFTSPRVPNCVNSVKFCSGCSVLGIKSFLETSFSVILPILFFPSQYSEVG